MQVEFINKNLFSFFHKFKQHCVDNLSFFLFYDTKMHIENCGIGPDVKKFSSLIYIYKFVEKPNKKKFTVEPKF